MNEIERGDNKYRSDQSIYVLKNRFIKGKRDTSIQNMKLSTHDGKWTPCKRHFQINP